MSTQIQRQEEAQPTVEKEGMIYVCRTHGKIKPSVENGKFYCPHGCTIERVPEGQYDEKSATRVPRILFRVMVLLSAIFGGAIAATIL